MLAARTPRLGDGAVDYDGDGGADYTYVPPAVAEAVAEGGGGSRQSSFLPIQGRMRSPQRTHQPGGSVGALTTSTATVALATLVMHSTIVG